MTLSRLKTYRYNESLFRYLVFNLKRQAPMNIFRNLEIKLRGLRSVGKHFVYDINMLTS